MNTLQTEHQGMEAEPAGAARPSAAARWMDIVLAGVLLVLLAPLLALAAPLARGRLQHRPVWGRGGAVVGLATLRFPAGWLGRVLAGLGATHVPLLWSILRGDIAFVGPRVRGLDEELPPATRVLRPGLVNPWFMRRRTAVDFGTEDDADAQFLAGHGLRHDAGLLLRGALVALLPPRAAVVPGRVRLCDVYFDNVDMPQALARLGAMLDGQQAQQVSFVNPACVNTAAAHRGYRRVLARAALVLPDGIGVKIASDLLGTPLKQNVNGTDLFPRLCEMLQARGARVYLLGGQPGVAERVAARLARQWPGVRIAGLRDGYFSVGEEGAVAAQVRRSGADVLLVARGVPAQDLFIDRYLPLLGVKVAMGVGGLFDFVSGRIDRAPMWMRETGLEWVHRLAQEPGRMWRRYLVGNVTFLARIALQRLGLRAPAADVQPARPTVALPPATRRQTAVLFATGRAAADLPVASDHPAALLPVGCQSLAELVLAQLALARVSDVHLVMCDHPELLRRTLGDGSRWGLRLHWHLVKDARRPYGLLMSEALRGASPLLLGHADTGLDAAALQGLQQGAAMAMYATPAGDLAWAGWAALSPGRLSTPMHDLDRAGLAQALAAAPVRQWLCAADQVTSVAGAEQLLQAGLRPQRDGLLAVPAAWVRTPWGAMSPRARVHAGATLVGPVLVGEGCVVERGATIGPAVVLSRNVVVSAGTHLQHTVVLPDSYIGADLDLAHTVVNGARVRHVRLGVESQLADADALLLDMSANRQAHPSWLGRALAWCLLPVVLPVLGAHLMVRRWSGRPLAWRLTPTVVGRNAAGVGLQLVQLRWPRQASPSRAGVAVALLAGLLDVAAGKRCWWGARPRSLSHWYTLRPEWQRILSTAPVGLLHAPAWADHAAHEAEATAAADIYWAVQSPWQRAPAMARWMVQLPARRGQRGAPNAVAAANPSRSVVTS